MISRASDLPGSHVFVHSDRKRVGWPTEKYLKVQSIISRGIYKYIDLVLIPGLIAPSYDGPP